MKRFSRVLRVALASSLLPALASCGGGGGGGGGPDVLTVTLPIDMTQTGSIDSAGFVFSAASSGLVFVGDQFALGSDLEFRGFLSFSLVGVPTNIVIDSAVLTMKGHVESGDPWTNLDFAFADKLNLGGTLGPAAFGAAGTAPALFPIFLTGADQTKSLDVTAALNSNLNENNSTMTVRVFFDGAPENNSLSDWIWIRCDAANPLERPSILVTYH